MSRIPTDASVSGRPFECDPSVHEYQVSEKEYLRQHPEHHFVCTGVTVFNTENKLLLVQRAKTERAFPEFWEIPGGKVDEPDETIIHGAVRELKEETGLEAVRVVRKVGMFTFGSGPVRWVKYIFEMEVKDLDCITLDPIEHDAYLWASEEEVVAEQVGDVRLKYFSPDNKFIKLESFRHRREAASLQ
ncbi:hypothetical protein DM02DRAFT_556302 [Periconia macrospinosa]|uniref:Nudix hydrolase domain-containing protein n=1 Tax=Periconia macrospinosa TaxID=97972 RepID=A0A2V1E1P2_9PLEO|nr:hypothetical protein DM02DRAFT_556302 [Periconia macrospinosa]